MFVLSLSVLLMTDWVTHVAERREDGGASQLRPNMKMDLIIYSFEFPFLEYQ